MSKTERLISHSATAENLEETISTIKKRIIQEGDKPHVSIERQLALLDEMCGFDLGCFLLTNHGLNGYWTHRIVTHPLNQQIEDKQATLAPLEKFLLEKAPCMRATQERFTIFIRECQKKVAEGAVLTSVPCGMMGDLLSLDFSQVENISLVGVDFDPQALKLAGELSERKNLSSHVELIQRDAWNLGVNEQFDLVSSNGLNVYEPDNDRVTALYRQFYQALKPGGVLVTSFLTFPPGSDNQSEWNLEGINLDDLLLQQILFKDIIQAGWQCFRTSDQTRMQLTNVGFSNVEFVYDKHRMFPTVIAMK